MTSFSVSGGPRRCGGPMQRHGHGQGCPASVTGLCADVPAECVDGVRAPVQADSMVGDWRLRGIAVLEDSRQVIGVDSDSVIGESQRQRLAPVRISLDNAGDPQLAAATSGVAHGFRLRSGTRFWNTCCNVDAWQRQRTRRRTRIGRGLLQFAAWRSPARPSRHSCSTREWQLDGLDDRAPSALNATAAQACAMDRLVSCRTRAATSSLARRNDAPRARATSELQEEAPDPRDAPGSAITGLDLGQHHLDLTGRPPSAGVPAAWLR